MLEARKTSAWSGQYDLFADGTRIAAWDPSFWRNGGTLDLTGRRFQIKASGFGRRYEMLDEVGQPVAIADRVGRRDWTVWADGVNYTFRRASFWGSDQHLMAGATPVGSISKVSMWRGDAVADLPGLPLPVQVFVVTVVLALWRQQAGAAAAGA